MINLEIEAGYRAQADSQIVANAAEHALRHQAAPAEASLTIVITGDEQLRALNEQFRGINAPTDVLSFPADFTDPEDNSLYLGDILISYPRAAAQAAEAGHSAGNELQLLVVHGVLHLLGYDHATPKKNPSCGLPKMKF